jgi:hypothetical protein
MDEQVRKALTELVRNWHSEAVNRGEDSVIANTLLENVKQVQEILDRYAISD